MILTRAPLRISFAGGGSDLPAFYQDEPGAVFSTTINAYMHLAVNRKFDGAVRVSYSQTENVKWARQLQHDLARETLLYCGIERSVEIVSVSDVPAGTGLGSSSAYAVALLQALWAFHHDRPEPERLAASACQVELDRCQHPIGKQDQYATAFGGLRLYEFLPDSVRPGLTLTGAPAQELERHLMLWYTGTSREADAVLRAQTQALAQGTARATTRRLVELAHAMPVVVQNGQLRAFAELLDEAWQRKRAIVPVIGSDQVETLLANAKRAGAWAGKLCGAGGSGFVLLCVPPDRQEAVRRVLNVRPVRELRFRFEPHGSQIVYDTHYYHSAHLRADRVRLADHSRGEAVPALS